MSRTTEALPALAPAVAPALPAPVALRPAARPRFLSHSLLLEEGGTPGLVRLTILVILGLIGAFAAWASVAEIQEVAHGAGEVVPDLPIQRLQHLEGGIVQAILVREGELVEAGQTLVTLDPTAAQAELEQLRTRAAALALQAERLGAFAAGRRPDFDRVPGAPAALVADQQAVFAGQAAARESQRRVILHQIEQRRQERAILAEQERSARATAALVAQERQMRATLLAGGLTSRLQMLEVERRQTQILGEIERLAGEQVRTAEALAEAERRLEEVEHIQARDALAQMGSVLAELAQLREAIARRADQVGRLAITAPVRGLVKHLAVSTLGGVITPGGEVLQIVPLGERVIVESRIQPRDIGLIREGMGVAVKVSAYDYSRFGALDGTIETILPSTFIDEHGQPYYRARIVLARPHFGDDPRRNLVIPGMTVQVDTPTGAKTLLEYLFRPISVGLHSAFTER